MQDTLAVMNAHAMSAFNRGKTRIFSKPLIKLSIICSIQNTPHDHNLSYSLLDCIRNDKCKRLAVHEANIFIDTNEQHRRNKGILFELFVIAAVSRLSTELQF